MSELAAGLPRRKPWDIYFPASLRRAALAVLLALACTGVLIMFSGKDPLLAFRAMLNGAFGSPDRIAVGLNKATPYILTGLGIAMCFRAKIINIGGEGQIAIGGLCAAWAGIMMPVSNPVLAIASALVLGIVGGMAWAGLAAAIHIGRRVHEVLVTLLLNFVALLIVGAALHGSLGEEGAGFPQSPLLPPEYWLPKLVEGTQLHYGVLAAVIFAIAAHVFLWHTKYGFALRVFGSSRPAALYAGISPARSTFMVMLLAGGLAGLAGGIEVLGIHYRLIEGFSHGFGFNAVAIALLGALNPLAIIPAGLFFGFLETGALAMQRQVGVPSSLVTVIQGLTMLFVLAAMASANRKS
jgi:general nucleoside transport system permease protein